MFEYMCDVLWEMLWGFMSYFEYCWCVEFGCVEYIEIGDYVMMCGFDWFVLLWDVFSVEFLEDLNVVVYKVVLVSFIDIELLFVFCEIGKFVILFIGMLMIV